MRRRGTALREKRVEEWEQVADISYPRAGRGGGQQTESMEEGAVEGSGGVILERQATSIVEPGPR